MLFVRQRLVTAPLPCPLLVATRGAAIPPPSVPSSPKSLVSPAFLSPLSFDSFPSPSPFSFFINF
jgi:hypothetical protein